MTKSEKRHLSVCPVEGCETHIPRDRLMCVKHARLIPLEVRVALQEAGKVQREGRDGFVRCRDARDAAIRAVNSLLERA